VASAEVILVAAGVPTFVGSPDRGAAETEVYDISVIPDLFAHHCTTTVTAIQSMWSSAPGWD
jgi:hypothetical protein